MHNFSTNDIFAIRSFDEFEKLSIKIFNYQAKYNKVYKEYLFHLGINTSSINTLADIPFLPIEFFKTHKVIVDSKKTEKVFYSSGTTGQKSNHFIHDLTLYEKSFYAAFENQYGDLKDTCILALLPNYLENESSSLVYMVDHLTQKSNHRESGFYLNNLKDLAGKLQDLQKLKTKCILIGVSYALIDLAEKFPMQLSNTIIMETGGMKGKRKELTKLELHKFLSSKFGLKSIHSEYGMTELLSQAYSK